VGALSLWSVWLKAGGRHPSVFHELTERRSISGQELTSAALEWETRLGKMGRQRRILLCGKNSSRWFAQFLAIQKMECAAILLDGSLSREAVTQCGHQFGVAAVLHEEKIEVWGSARKQATSGCVYKVTSGTTGEPKLIPCSAHNLMADGRQIIEGMGIRRRDRQLGILPFGHSYGLGNLVMPLILQGTPVWTAGEWTISQIPDWINRHQLTVFPSVPSVLTMLCHHPRAVLASSLRLVISAGGPLPRETAMLFNRKYHRKIRNFYGASETGGIAYDRTGQSGLRGDATGKPLPGVHVSFTSQGRIRVTSHAVAKPSYTHILPDQGSWTKDGRLKWLGRVERVANIGGKKARPGEVNALLAKIPGVSGSFVDVLHLRGRDFLAAWYAGKVKPEIIRSALQKILPSWKIPRPLIQLKSLPLTARGKLDTACLRRLVLSSIRRA